MVRVTFTSMKRTTHSSEQRSRVDIFRPRSTNFGSITVRVQWNLGTAHVEQEQELSGCAPTLQQLFRTLAVQSMVVINHWV